MILKKNYDLAVIGKSYFHNIYALEAIKEKKSVLVLEDDRMNFGRLHRYGAGLLELSYFNTIGIDLGVDDLKESKLYARNIPLTFNIDNKRFFLGRSPSQNLLELARKYPHFFKIFNFLENRDTFDQDFDQYIQKLGADAYRFKMIQDIDLGFLTQDAPVLLKKIYDHFKTMVSENSEEMRSFLYHTRSFYHKVLTSSHPEYEVFHLLICLLSRHFMINENRLVRDLETAVLSRGGSYKKAQLKDWKFYKSRPWCIELSSFEGIVHPLKMAFIGLDPKTLHIQTNAECPLYQAVHFKMSLNPNLLERHKNSLIRSASSRDMASFFTSWQFFINNDGLVDGLCLVKKLEGNKESFIFEDFLKHLQHSLSMWYDLEGENIKDHVKSFHMGEEIYPDTSFTFNKPSLSHYKSIHLTDHSRPHRVQSLKNVAYYGPLKRQGFGLFGQLLELKEGSYFR